MLKRLTERMTTALTGQMGVVMIYTYRTPWQTVLLASSGIQGRLCSYILVSSLALLISSPEPKAHR